MPLCPCALVSRAQDSQSRLGGAQQVNSYSTSRLLCPCQREAINLLLKDGSDTKGINMTWPLSTPAHRPSLLPHFQGPHSNSYLLWGLGVLISQPGSGNPHVGGSRGDFPGLHDNTEHCLCLPGLESLCGGLCSGRPSSRAWGRAY